MQITLISKELSQTRSDLSAVEAYPFGELVDIIKDVGFECSRCTRCCTRDYNDHVFLLENDVERIEMVDSSKITPAPYFDYCDNKGNFYVQGYALTYKDDGTCAFLGEDDLCAIYTQRPAICSIYPYMLNREPNSRGKLLWRHVAGLNEHGYYHCEMTEKDAMQIAKDVLEYETGFLQHRIDFLTTLLSYFRENKLKPSQRQYERQMKKYNSGKEIVVNVYHCGQFHTHRIADKS